MAFGDFTSAWTFAPVAGGLGAAAMVGGLAWHFHATSAAPRAPEASLPAGNASAALSMLPAAPPIAPAGTTRTMTLEAGGSGAPAPSKSEISALDIAVPSFDVVRVEKTGDVLLAGRGAPGARVSAMDGEKIIGSGTVDANGQFVLLPAPLPPGSHVLSLRMKLTDQPPVGSSQEIAVSIPAKPDGGVLAALAAPGQPTRVLSDRAPDSVATAPAKVANLAAGQAGGANISIQAVEAEQGGSFFASGLASAGADVRLYLNGAFVAAMRAAENGHWSLKVSKGMRFGHFEVRADQMDVATGEVVARTQVPFDYPPDAESTQPAANLPTADAIALAERQRNPEPPLTRQQAPTIPGKSPLKVPPALAADNMPAEAADVVIPEIRTATVIRGDSLWRISRVTFGHGIRYTQLYEANANQIQNPRLIFPGQILVVPAVP